MSSREMVEKGVFAETNPTEIANVFKASGLFPDLKSEAQAFVKVIAGRELGIGPMAAMQGLFVIEGKVTFSANLLAAQVKQSPTYDYLVREHGAAGCRIDFLQNGEVIGTSEFTMEDATRAGVAGKSNWKRYPKAMMFARALSQGVRWYCPDVTAGSPAYVPEELGAETTAEGEPITAEVVPAPELAASREPVPPEVPLDAETIATITAIFAQRQMKIKEIDLALGAAGIDGLRAQSKQAVEERLAALSVEESDALINELEREEGTVA